MTLRARLVSIAMLAAAPAWATTGDCTTAPDGTPCATQCLVGGMCKAKTCVGGIAAPDGTPCVTGSACTVNDACQGGVCTAGPPRSCATEDPCQAPSCDPAVGCVYTWVCDGGAPDMTTLSDMSPADAAPLDGEVGDLPDGGRGDRHCVDCDGEFSDGEVGDGAGADGTMSDASGDAGDGGMADLAPLGHVHGSGCSTVGAGSDEAGAWIAFAGLLVVLGVRRRRRA